MPATGRAARRAEIVRVAGELLAEDGREGVSMRRIADRLGMRAPSLYKHFPDKRALEHALISAGFEQLAAAFTDALAAADQHDPLRTLAITYRRFATQRAHLYRLMTEDELDRSLLAPGVEDAASRPLVDALAGDGDLARAAFAFVHGMTVLELNRRFPPDADLDAAWERGIAALTPTPG